MNTTIAAAYDRFSNLAARLPVKSSIRVRLDGIALTCALCASDATETYARILRAEVSAFANMVDRAPESARANMFALLGEMLDVEVAVQAEVVVARGGRPVMV